MHSTPRRTLGALRTLRDRVAGHRRTNAVFVAGSGRHRRDGSTTGQRPTAMHHAVPHHAVPHRGVTHHAAGGRSAKTATLSIAAVAVIAAGFVGGGAFTPTAGTVDTANRLVVDRTTADRATANRDAAAQRADRSGRTTPQPLTTPSTAPSVAPSTAPGTAPTLAPTKAPTVAPAAPSKPDWVSPMPGVPLSSCYGMRAGTLHQGIDFAGNAGTAIHAVGAGTVVATGWIYTGYGISVVIDHGNGYLSHYAHASQTLVQVGQKVTAGQTVALEGATGDATGPHLHFEIHQGMWNQIDPAPWLRAHGVPVGC